MISKETTSILKSGTERYFIVSFKVIKKLSDTAYIVSDNTEIIHMMMSGVSLNESDRIFFVGLICICIFFTNSEKIFECLSRFHFSLNMFTVLFMMLADKRNKIFWSADIFVGLLNFLTGHLTFQKNTIECLLLTFLSLVPHPIVFY